MTTLLFLPGELPQLALWRLNQNDAVAIYNFKTTKPTGPEVLDGVFSLLASERCDIKNITHIGAMVGPASYTQLRIFVSTANAMAWSLALPLFSLRPHDVLPEALPSRVRTAKQNTPLEPVYPPLRS